MFSLMPRIDTFNGMIPAYLLAVIFVYPIVRTNLFTSFTRWLGKMAPNQFFHRHARWLAYLFIVALLGTLLTIVINLEPVRGRLINSFFTFSQDQSQWNRYSSFMMDLLTILGILVLFSFIPIVNKLFSRIDQNIDNWRHSRFRVIKIHNLEILTPDQLADMMILSARYVRYATILLLVSACLTLVFSLYPETEGLAQALLAHVIDVLNTLWDQTLTFLPNLITLIVIIAITRVALKVLHFFYDGLHRGKIRYSGIDLELVEPTYQLLRFLVIAFALVAVFPYIPGSSSPVFKGLSIFVGFLLSLGSTSLVTNIVSGIVLTYTRGLRIGDRVQIAGSVGDVIERTILVTRIRTIKNVIISIPNSKVLQNEIINYSAEAGERGLILPTSVTIGYDVPWRKVQQLLIDAALETPNIVKNPPPFVLKTSLDDSYITYELNAYTAQASLMANTYSEMHQNILDKFNKADVEIMSPTYFAVRDGQNSTIPQVEFSGNGNGNGNGHFHH